MADISDELTAIANSQLGEEVRYAITSALTKLSDEGDANLAEMRNIEDTIESKIREIGGGGDG